MKPIIEIQHISKKFMIGGNNLPYQNLRDTLVSAFRSGKSSKEEYWALNDVSFDVMPGESIGIVGKNGAGKSTLLKILSRITPPTKGKIISRGRIASLLEVGTGFHPELTGRENVLLNGSILGMKRSETLSKFDEIVEFSGVEKFIDTPLKHYSSGMQLRLAFAVAAFLEPEILVIDEVLAVGDAEFQRKCMGKMQDVSKSGRTVLFVSHNMTAVSSLCSRAVLLEKGSLTMVGQTQDVVNAYLKGNNGVSLTSKFWTEPLRQDDGVIALHSMQLTDEQGVNITFVDIDQPCLVELEYSILKEGHKPIPNIHISSAKGEKLLVTVEPDKELSSKPGKYKSIIKIPQNFFNEGAYVLGVAVSTLNPVIVHTSDYEGFYFEVVDKLDAITRNAYVGKFDGLVRPLFDWKTKKID